MAKKLEISDGTNTVNILDGVFSLADGGWESQDADEPVWETFALIAKGTDTQIRTEQDKLDKLIEKARIYVDDDTETTPVYLNVQSEGESLKRVVVMDGRVVYKADSNISPLLGANLLSSETGALVTLAILRTPYFEPDDTGDAFASSPGVSCDGGQWLIGNAAGVADQRISKVEILDLTNPEYKRNKIWLGIRRLKYGTTGFKSKWEAELAGVLGTDTTTTLDAAASGGSKVTISFATATALTERIVLKAVDVSADGADMMGEYLVLGRVKLNAGTTEVRLQLRQGYAYIRKLNEIAGDTYLSAITNANLTNWNLVELGHIKFAAPGNRDAQATWKTGADQYGFQIYAERISAAGSIEIDCFYLIPTERFAYMDNVEVGVTTSQAYIFTSPLNEQYAVGSGTPGGSTAFDYFYTINYALSNWFYPAEGGMLVLAAQQTTVHDLGKVLYFNFTLFPRYKWFRV